MGNQEEYILKKQEKEQDKLKQIRKAKTGRIINISLIIVIISSISFFLGSYFFGQDKTGNDGTPKIAFASDMYDAGVVSMSSGLVKNTYEVKNEGDSDLKIDGIWTSCMCTTARLKVGDKTSPEFGMHSRPLFWSEIIPPGETGYLEVSFDPAFHGSQGTGQAVRIIYLSTNDPNNKEAQVQLSANVIN